MKKVAVYCSSRVDLPAEVEAGTKRIVSCIGRNGASLIYGGVNAGLMHTVAQAAADSGANIIGVVPEVFAHRADNLCNEVIMTYDLNDRKGKMIEMADIFIVLPGGIGTIDEWISTLSYIMVREKAEPGFDKPILVWNHDDMYAGQISQMQQTAHSVYARGKHVDRSLIFNSAKDLERSLAELLKE